MSANSRKAVAERLLAILRTLGRELHPHRRDVARAGLGDSLEKDFGIDSLARVELTLRIERDFSVRLPDELTTAAETPAELLRAIEVAAPWQAETPMPSIALPAQAATTPIGAATLVDVLEFHVDAHGDRTHLHILGAGEEREVITYRDLWNSAHVIAAGLRDRELQIGQRVAIMLPTGREFFEVFVGTLLAGGVPVPIYPPFRRSALGEHLARQAAILGNAQASVFVAPPEARLFGRLVFSQVDSLRQLVTIDELRSSDGATGRPLIQSESYALFQYTSGSTGDPKGVVLTHQNILSNIRAMGEAFDARSEDVVVSWLPLYHDMGLIGTWMGSLYFACPLVVMSPMSFLARPQRWLWAIHQYRGTFSAAPNFAYEICASRIDERELEGLDLGSWRMAGNGAEEVSPQSLKRFCDRFAKYGFQPRAMTPMYGLAECAVALTSAPLGRGPLIDRIDRTALTRNGEARPADQASASAVEVVGCGLPIPGHEVRIVDDAGREVGERTQGQLEFRGPSATGGYFRDPRKTAELFDDGWLKTGDLGYVADGEVYITGRAKDIVIRAGRNIYPEEIEELVGDVPGIRKGRVAVFGARIKRTETDGMIVLAETRVRDRAKRNALVEQIQSLIVDQIGLPPDDVVLGAPGSVLKTLNGKVRRAACAELYEADRIGRPAPALWLQLVDLVKRSAAPMLRRWLRTAGAVAFAAWFWTVYRLLAPIVFVGVMLIPGVAARRRFFAVGAKTMARLIGAGPFVRGLDNVPERERCIVVANHSSFLDGLMLSAALPPRFSFVAKRELVEAPIARRFLEALGTQFVERFDVAGGVADTKRLVETLKSGQSLIFFPEGTFDRRPGLRSFEMGAFVAATEAGVPVVPVGISGTRSMLRAETSFARASRVAVVIAPPIAPEGTDWNAAIRLRDRARAAVLSNCREPDLVYEAKPI